MGEVTKDEERAHVSDASDMRASTRFAEKANKRSEEQKTRRHCASYSALPTMQCGGRRAAMAAEVLTSRRCQMLELIYFMILLARC